MSNPSRVQRARESRAVPSSTRKQKSTNFLQSVAVTSLSVVLQVQFVSSSRVMPLWIVIFTSRLSSFFLSVGKVMLSQLHRSLLGRLYWVSSSYVYTLLNVWSKSDGRTTATSSQKSPLGCATLLPVKCFQIFGEQNIVLKNGQNFTGKSVAQPNGLL